MRAIKHDNPTRTSVVRTSDANTLPAMPDLGEVLRKLKARRDALASVQLPRVARDAANIVETWRCDDREGERIHAANVTVHPAGAERVMHYLAEYEALRLDVASLDELIAALELWEQGGAATINAIDGCVSPAAEATTFVGAKRSTAETRVFSRWQLEYLLSLKTELHAARATGDFGRSEALAVEFAGLLRRVQQRSVRTRAA